MSVTCEECGKINYGWTEDEAGVMRFNICGCPVPVEEGPKDTVQSIKQEFTGNTSGFRAVDTKCIILLDDIAMKTATGKLYLPDTVRDKERIAQVKATLVDFGGNAFDDWKPPIPEVGDRIYVARYAGIRDIVGVDGRKYQFIQDEDIITIIDEE